MVLVARSVSPREFGLYSLAYTGLLFANSVQSSLFVQPHASLGAPRSGSAYVSYTTDTAWLQAGFAILTAMVIAVAGTVMHARQLWIAPVVIALTAAAPAWQLQEFTRRALYVRSRIRQAFVNDLLSYAGQVVVLTYLATRGWLGPASAILAMAGTWTAATFLGAWQIRDQIAWCHKPASLHTTMRENWTFGKWLLGGDLAFWTSGQIYPLFAAAFVNVAATGLMRAAQTILGPTTVLIISIDSMFSPHAARAYAHGGMSELRYVLARLQLILGVAMSGYCVVVALLARPIFAFVYGPDYARHSWMLSVLSITTLIASLRSPIRIGFKALRQTEPVFKSYLASSVVNLTLGVLIVRWFGMAGLAMGLGLNSVVLQGMIWRYQRRCLGGSLHLMTTARTILRTLAPHTPPTHIPPDGRSFS
jgi:O-antigen/teichoic acid export membrane protein